MELALRPHRGGTVLGLGMLSLGLALAGLALALRRFGSDPFCVVVCLVAIPSGVLAIALGWRQVVGMRAGRIDPSGRSRTRTGQALAAAAVVLSVALSTFIIVYFPADRMELRSDGTSVVTEMYYDHVPKVQYLETLGPDGHFIKDGPFVMWSRSGKKLEVGTYRDGKRDGEWTFWNEDGSIDQSRSGLYENEVRVSSDATPPGDYQPRPAPPGYKERR